MGKPPSGQKWEALRTIHEVNSTLQRLVALPPGAPQAGGRRVARGGRASQQRPGVRGGSRSRLIEFAPDYDTGADINERARGMLVASPEIRAFVADYIKSANK